jgi:hypothetical protein
MISFYRTASVQPGKTADAIAHAKAIAEHLEKTHGYKVQVAHYDPCGRDAATRVREGRHVGRYQQA